MNWFANFKSESVSDVADKVINCLATLKSVPGVAEKVVDKGLSYLESEVKRFHNVEDGLQRLRRTAVRIHYLLTDAEERRYIQDDTVKGWLSDLKSVSFDTDALLDEYQTALCLYNHNSNSSSSSARSPSRKRKWHQISISMGPQWGPLQRRRFASEIEKIDSRLAEIAQGRTTLRLRGTDGPRRESTNQRAPPSRPAGPTHDPAVVIGRQDEKDHIINLLISDQSSEGNWGTKVLPVVPIHGASGIGKTTLARLVQQDARIHRHFDFTAWVSLTDNCDVFAAMNNICEKITGQRCDFGGLDALQNCLRSYLKTCARNKFLLVVDNYWANDFTFWETVRVPLLEGGQGSKVLITTCNKRACEIMQGVLSQPCLKGLNEEDCWQLIKSIALPPDNSNHDDKDLVQTGKEIARKCLGSPMAAKALGAVLFGRDSEEWSDVLDEMQPLNDDFNVVVRESLKIGYHHLPYNLKQCFAYCSVFPNDFAFERDQLVRCWLAEGLIQPNGRRRLEAVGNKYFDELIWRSFFEKVTIDVKDQNAKPFSPQLEKYRMPSLIHNLATLVSRYEFRGLVSGERIFEPKDGKPDQARYASFLQTNDDTVRLQCIEPYPNLRTLKFYHKSSDGVVLMNSMPANFFRKFMDLRVLDMSNSDLKQVPDSVGGLIHLRFLGLSNTNITTLPEKIGDLFNLQTLELKGCSGLAVLPQGLCRLINLRHLDLHHNWEEITDSTKVVLPQGIGELENLQTLSRFNVTSDKGQYCSINELRALNLRGDLCLLNLEKVKMGQATVAYLEGKQFVEKLMLRWDSLALNDEQLQQQSEEVIKALQPHNKLKYLRIVNYPGTKFPNWMGDEPFSSLKTIQISNCNNFNFLLLLNKLLRLENLQVDNVPGEIMSMPEGFPSLKHLHLLNLSSLKKLFLKFEIPDLEQIHVNGCNDLQELFIHRDMYDKFERENCPNLTNIVREPQDYT